jgi:hypothetical protein
MPELFKPGNSGANVKIFPDKSAAIQAGGVRLHYFIIE